MCVKDARKEGDTQIVRIWIQCRAFREDPENLVHYRHRWRWALQPSTIAAASEILVDVFFSSGEDTDIPNQIANIAHLILSMPDHICILTRTRIPVPTSSGDKMTEHSKSSDSISSGGSNCR